MLLEELEEICSLNNYTKEKAEKKIIDVLLMIGFSKYDCVFNSRDYHFSSKIAPFLHFLLNTNPWNWKISQHTLKHI